MCMGCSKLYDDMSEEDKAKHRKEHQEAEAWLDERFRRGRKEYNMTYGDMVKLEERIDRLFEERGFDMGLTKKPKEGE